MNQSVRNRNILTVLNLQTQTLVVIYCQTPVLHNLSIYQKIEQTGEALYYGCSLVGLSVGWLSRWDDSNLGQMKEMSGADLLHILGKSGTYLGHIIGDILGIFWP